eukprot:TRINITY_DN122398_c0_g1_i1.p1 TRINITY_DN122398_c0_g1~~TRINITY_DN122398_c0_g1_i1.p1  ORF type:complete len:344 (+),score=53.41 TRINITY_DN122398_c0_g1_i1:168-1199(+)
MADMVLSDSLSDSLRLGTLSVTGWRSVSGKETLRRPPMVVKSSVRRFCFGSCMVVAAVATTVFSAHSAWLQFGQGSSMNRNQLQANSRQLKAFPLRAMMTQTRPMKLRRKVPRVRPEDPRDETDLMAPLPWPTETTEIMIDGMSVIQYFWNKVEKDEEALVESFDKNDIHGWWPLRVFMAAQELAEAGYGVERPPSPWQPLTAVFDIPDKNKITSGLKIKRWHTLTRQGPSRAGNCTLSWAQVYVDQSAAERVRCDREILYMLEVITRQYPQRRQVLVTSDRRLGQEAKRFCTVRSPKWFEKEVLKTGEGGKKAIEALLGGSDGVQNSLKRLPMAVQRAFQAG